MPNFKPQVKSYEHQRKFVQWIWQKTTFDDIGGKGGGAFFDPGTGKTKAAYDFVSASYLHRKTRRALVLCPINAIGVWDEQADLHILKEIPFRVVIPQGKIQDKTETLQNWNGRAQQDELWIMVLNYAAIIKRDKRWEILKAIQAYAPDILILDESHHIKNATTKQAKAAHKIAQFTQNVLILTGTPIGKNYLDLYSQLKAVDPRIWKARWTRTGNMSWTDFRNHYGVFGGRTGYELRGYRNLPDLKSRYIPQIRTARKESILDMPTVTDSVIPLELNGTARRVYDVFADEGVVGYKNHIIEAPIPLTKLLRLQQMTGGWVHDELSEVVEIHRQKIAILAEILEELRSSGRGVVVFARFLAEIEAIEKVAEKVYGRAFRISGSVTSESRRQIVRDFSTGSSVLVIQIAAAEALDGLQDNCSYGIFYSTDFSLIHWNQARGRLDRVGQRNPVTFYHLQCKRTVDSLILQALKDKKNIERMVMDSPEVLLAR